jgi:hypothetical protein
MSWSAPVSRRTASFAAPVAIPAPPRPRKSGKPHWGLRFVLLLFLAGGVTYFLRPSVPWIHARLTGVEAGVRLLADRYGLINAVPVAAPAPTTTAPSPRPVVAAPAAEPAAPAAGAKGPAGRPEVTPLTTRPGVPPAEPSAPGAAQRGVGNRRFVREVGPRARGAALTVRPRAAARRAAAARGASGRARGFDEPEVTFSEAEDGFSPPKEPPPRLRRRFPSRAQAATRAAQAAASAEAAAEAAAAPAVAAAEPEAPAPAAAPPAPPPAADPPEERRSAVREAMRSGDELDRLMASAVVESRASASQGRPSAAVERRVAEVDPGKPAPRARAEAAAQAKEPPLGRDAIQTVMKDVQKKMNDCYRRHGQQGAADVRIEVNPDGTVASGVVRGMLANTPTAGCVEATLKEAAFPASGGITFNYRLLVK